MPEPARQQRGGRVRRGARRAARAAVRALRRGAVGEPAHRQIRARRTRRAPLSGRRRLVPAHGHDGRAVEHGHAHGSRHRPDRRRIPTRLRRRRQRDGGPGARHAHARQKAARLEEQSGARADAGGRHRMARCHGRDRPEDQPRRDRRIMPHGRIRAGHGRMQTPAADRGDATAPRGCLCSLSCGRHRHCFWTA